MSRKRKLSTTCTLALAISLAVSARASAQKLPSLFFSPGSQASLWSEWAGGGSTSSGSRAVVRPAIFAYELVAYVAKEVLDDASYEYQESPIGSFLARQTPAQHSRSEFAAIPGSIVTQDPPPNLDYPVRRVALRDLWSGLNNAKDSPSAFSVDPKVGAGKAGLLLTFRW